MKYHSLKQIADSIGVNKVTVYQHYQHLKRSRGASFTAHVKTKPKILMDEFADKLILRSFKKINKNNNLMLIKSYQSRINDLEDEVRTLSTALSKSQALERTEQLKLAKPVSKRGKKHGFLYKIRRFFQ